MLSCEACAMPLDEAVRSLADTAEQAGKQMAGGAGGYLRAMRSASAGAKSATADQKALAKESRSG